MACSGCRKPPRVIRKPSVGGNANPMPSVTRKDDGKNAQRDKIVGLKYVPKD